jgi:hypothetical protein
MKRFLFLLAVAATAATTRAQMVVSTFSIFAPDEYSGAFDGGPWSDLTAESGAGVFTIGDFGNGVPSGNMGNRFVSFLAAPQDWSQFTSVILHGTTSAANQTPNLYLYLEDVNLGSSSWTQFDLTSFGDGVESVALDFTGVDATHITVWGFAVQDPGTPDFNFAFDQLQLVAIPEPSAAALLGGLASLIVLVRRQRSTS